MAQAEDSSCEMACTYLLCKYHILVTAHDAASWGQTLAASWEKSSLQMSEREDDPVNNHFVMNSFVSLLSEFLFIK